MYVYLLIFLLCPISMYGALTKHHVTSPSEIDVNQFAFTLSRKKTIEGFAGIECFRIKTTLTEHYTQNQIEKTVGLSLKGEVCWSSEGPSFACLPQDRKMMRELFQKAIVKFGLIRERPDPDSDDEDNLLIADSTDLEKADATYAFNVVDGEPTTPVITFDNKITEVEDEDPVHIKPRCQHYCDILLLGVSAGIILPLAIWAQYTAID